VHPVRSAEGQQFDPADFEARYIEFARLLGFVSKHYPKDSVQAGRMLTSDVWAVLLDGEWYTSYGSEFRAAMEYIRYHSYEQAMREALDAIGAGEAGFIVPAYRNP
jgi:hypothetical protein